MVGGKHILALGREESRGAREIKASEGPETASGGRRGECPVQHEDDRVEVTPVSGSR